MKITGTLLEHSPQHYVYYTLVQHLKKTVQIGVSLIGTESAERQAAEGSGAPSFSEDVTQKGLIPLYSLELVAPF